MSARLVSLIQSNLIISVWRFGEIKSTEDLFYTTNEEENKGEKFALRKTNISYQTQTLENCFHIYFSSLCATKISRLR